jgi:glyoxylase-like metal-dependent hydrolase (beta-lactamase superfamily II)
MTAPLIIDTKMHGRDGITAAFLLTGEDGSHALVETGPKSSVEHVLEGLRGAGVDRLDAILVTHIHLDHAGAAGTLVKEFPGTPVYVHEVGAPHLIDPAKLWSSASRIYGDAMEALWGGIDPIPEANVRALTDGDRIEVAGRTLRAVDTPGHAYHHHAYLDESSGSLFTGDALGVRLPDVGVVRPATPPPEFHLRKAIESIERLRDLEPADVWLTHFGPQVAGGIAVRDLCDEAVDSLERWAAWVREARAITSELDEATDVVKKLAAEHMEGRIPQDAIDRLEQTTSYRMNVSGYMRYIDKNEGPD